MNLTESWTGPFEPRFRILAVTSTYAGTNPQAVRTQRVPTSNLLRYDRGTNFELRINPYYILRSRTLIASDTSSRYLVLRINFCRYTVSRFNSSDKNFANHLQFSSIGGAYNKKDNTFSWWLWSFDAVRIHTIDNGTDKIGIENRADVEQMEYHCDTQKLQAAQSSHDCQFN